MKVLNKGIVREIKSQLRSLNWEDTPEKRDKLFAFLEGVRLALIEKGLNFDLCIQRGEFSVKVYKYANRADCQSDEIPICRIYENAVKQLS